MSKEIVWDAHKMRIMHMLNDALNRGLTQPPPISVTAQGDIDFALGFREGMCIATANCITLLLDVWGDEDEHALITTMSEAAEMAAMWIESHEEAGESVADQ